MELNFFIRGLIIGFSIAAPVGPIGVLCVQRTLNRGSLVGFISGLGAATADGCYGLLAAFGLTAALSILTEHGTWFSLIGGIYLCFLGIKAFRSEPQNRAENGKVVGIFQAYLSTFFLTITNPMTILSFAAIFAGLGLGMDSGDYGSAAMLVLGVFLGSALWWFLLSGGAGLFRNKFETRHLRWINRVSGLIIFGFGCFILAGLI